MSDERFNDEILSAIIDGEADAETVAAVNDDASARERLSHMHRAVELVSSPVTDAAPERRSASIAAALAAASPAPEVSSLAAARHAREAAPKKRRQLQPAWIAVAAAVLAFVVAIPFLAGGNDAADTATDSSDSASLSIDDDSSAADETAEAAEDAMEEEADDSADAGDEATNDVFEGDAAMAESDADDSSDDGAMEEEESSAEEPTAATSEEIEAAIERVPDGFTFDDFVTVNNIDVLDSLIEIGSITSPFGAGDAVVAGVNPDCVRPNARITDDTPYALIVLSPFAGDERLVFVEFADDGTTRVLEAEDCAPLR